MEHTNEDQHERNGGGAANSHDTGGSAGHGGMGRSVDREGGDGHRGGGVTLPPIAASLLDPMMGMIERAARDPSVDIDKLERLFAMKERMDRYDREAQFNAAFSAAQAEMTPVAKNKLNKQTSSNYTDIAALADAITPIYTKHGFGVTFGSKPAPEQFVGIIADLIHAAGFSRRYEFDIPLDGKGLRGNENMTRIHGQASSWTYGRRYAKLMMWDIATKDDDGNAASKRSAPAVTVDDLRKVIAETNADQGKICAHFSIETLDDLTPTQISQVMTSLRARQRAGSGK